MMVYLELDTFQVCYTVIQNQSAPEMSYEQDFKITRFSGKGHHLTLLFPLRITESITLQNLCSTQRENRKSLDYGPM